MEVIKEREGKIGKLIKEFNIVAIRYDTFQDSIDKIDNLKDFKDLVAIDTETTSLTLWKDGNYIIGYSLSISDIEGYYFNSRLWSDIQHIKFINKLNELKNDKTFWNWYFDYGYSKAHYDIGLEATHDGMLWFHTLFTSRSLEKLPFSEKNKGFSLKEITTEFTEYGDYESELKNTKKNILFELNKKIINKEILDLDNFYAMSIKLNLLYEFPHEANNVINLMNKVIDMGVTLKEKEFCYGFLPDNVLDIYAILDVLCTWNLTNRCIKYAKTLNDKGWEKLYDIISIKHKVTKIYADASIRGFKVDREYVKKLSDEWKPLREMSFAVVHEMPEIKKVEKMLFREALLKEQSKKRPFIIENFSKKEFNIYFKNELIKTQSKLKNTMLLSRCRKVYNLCKVKWDNKKNKCIKMSKVSLQKCRNIFNLIEFNLNSPQHKYKLFIDLLGLEPLEYNKANKKGEKSPKLNNEFVEHYARLGYDFMDKVNIYSLYQKGISSFLGTDDKSKNGMWKTTTDKHPYNHSNFRLSGTLTSRLAMSNLNLSQFPSRGVLHKAKDCFIVEEGYKLFTFDYKTSELRILGALSKEPNFKEAFDGGLDLHSATAWSIWKDKMDIDNTLSLKDILVQVKEKYSDTFRYFAKSINFSLPYDTSSIGLSKAINVSKEEAGEFIESYRNTNNYVADFMDGNKDKVRKLGYIEGSYGERIYFKNAKGYDWRKKRSYRNKNWDAIKELRKSTNFIMQSDNAFMLYYSLVTFFEEIEKINLGIELIATIYDSIYIRVPENLDNKIIYDLMVKHFEINFHGIPMLIDVGISLNEDRTYSKRWGHLTDVKYEDLDEITKINVVN